MEKKMDRKNEQIVINFAVATAKLIYLVIYNLINFIRLVVGIMYILYTENRVIKHIINTFLLISFYSLLVLCFVGIFIISYKIF